MGIETVHNISQSFSPCQLSKDHCNELLKATKMFYFVLSIVLTDMSAKSFSVNFFSDFGYDAETCSHGPPISKPFIRQKRHIYFSSQNN